MSCVTKGKRVKISVVLNIVYAKLININKLSQVFYIIELSYSLRIGVTVDGSGYVSRW